jgi:ribosome-binding protein aMBF1 (putative translation factor)
LYARFKYANYLDFKYRYANLHDYEVKTIATKRHKCLAKWLRAEREAKGLKQEDVAKRLRRSQAWIVRVETGQRPLHVVEFLAIAKAIGFDAIKMLRKLRDEVRENNSK